MRPPRSLAAHQWIALALAATLGCAKSDQSAGDTTKSASTPGGAPASGKTFTIAMIAKSSTNPVFLSGRQGAEAAAAELTKSSGVTVRIDWLTPPTEDGTVQAQRISQAVNAGDNAVLLS
ncbi:MAG TPA: hypothetical protein VKP00_04345, partial [Gemmatimonadaceae bacterium]|nr:hypothetical protein [Gemmatimonadaceae bacterium]